MELIEIIGIWPWLNAIFGAIIGAVFIHLIQKKSYVHAFLTFVAYAIFLIKIVRYGG